MGFFNKKSCISNVRVAHLFDDIASSIIKQMCYSNMRDTRVLVEKAYSRRKVNIHNCLYDLLIALIHVFWYLLLRQK